MLESLRAYEDQATEVLNASDELADLDLDSASGADEAWKRIIGRDSLPEHWAAVVGSVAAQLREELEQNPSKQTAAFLGHQLGTAWAMLMYTRHLEPLVWRGYVSSGVDNLRKVLKEWETNRDSADEEFWQGLLDDSPFVLSQVLPPPIVVVRDKAYVGGKTLDNSSGQLTDFLLAQAATGNVALLELKTPVTKLLSSRYRAGVFPPSRDLVGAVTQVLTQRDTLLGNRAGIGLGELTAFNSTCIVLVGNSSGARCG